MPQRGLASGTLQSWDAFLLGTIRHIGATFRLMGGAFAAIWKRPFEAHLILEQMENIGLKSLTIVSLTTFFTGMVLCLQTAYSFARFGAKPYVAKIIAFSLTRELGPVLCALIVSGRVGSGIAAELGSMAVTDQIDAMRVMGASPIKKLVMPRMVALAIMLPLLALVGDVLGILGGLVIAAVEMKIKASFYISSSLSVLSVRDILSGTGKCFFFALIITSVGCYQGLSTTGGTRGVGISTTKAVVISSILILVADFFLTKAFMLI